MTLFGTMEAKNNNFARSGILIVLLGCTITLPSIVVEAAYSGLCLDQSEELANNTELLAAAPKLDCYIDLDRTDKCIADFTTLSSEFKRLCLGAGGQFLETDLKFDCQANHPDTGQLKNADYYFVNLPICLGVNCTMAEIGQEQQQVTFPKIMRDLAAGGFSNCVVNETSPGDIESETSAGIDIETSVGVGNETSGASISVLSELCFNQTEAIANDTELQAAAPNLDCFIDLDKTDSCTVDFTAPSAEFKRLCLGLGGQFLETDLKVDCEANHPKTGELTNADLYFVNFPECWGVTCTMAEIVQDQQEVDFPKLSRDLAAGGFQNCVAKEIPSAGSGASNENGKTNTTSTSNGPKSNGGMKKNGLSRAFTIATTILGLLGTMVFAHVESF